MRGCVAPGDPAGHQDGGQFLRTGDDGRGCGGDGLPGSPRSRLDGAAAGCAAVVGARGPYQSGLPLRPPVSGSASVDQSAASSRRWASSRAPPGGSSVPLD